MGRDTKTMPIHIRVGSLEVIQNAKSDCQIVEDCAVYWNGEELDKVGTLTVTLRAGCTPTVTIERSVK